MKVFVWGAGIATGACCMLLGFETYCKVVCQGFYPCSCHGNWCMLLLGWESHYRAVNINFVRLFIQCMLGLSSVCMVYIQCVYRASFHPGPVCAGFSSSVCRVFIQCVQGFLPVYAGFSSSVCRVFFQFAQGFHPVCAGFSSSVCWVFIQCVLGTNTATQIQYIQPKS